MRHSPMGRPAVCYPPCQKAVRQAARRAQTVSVSERCQRILAPYTWSTVIAISTLRSDTITDRYSRADPLIAAWAAS
jgi:hypothetical protein